MSDGDSNRDILIVSINARYSHAALGPRYLLANMKERGVKYGIESMCIGGGMGAAALFELCD